MQNIFGSYMPKLKKNTNFPSHITHPPFKQASSGDVQSKTVPPATHIPQTNMHHAGQNKTKGLFGLVVSMRHAKTHEHAQGSFLPARTAAKMAFASSLLYTPVAVQFTSYIPACFSHAPTKTFCEQIAKTS